MDISSGFPHANYNEPVLFCFLCQRVDNIRDNSTSKEQCEQSHLQHLKKLFQCSSKYMWPDPLNEYFSWTFNDEEENNCNLCADCLSCLEKFFEMNQLLKEMKKGIQEFIDFFSKQVLDFQKQNDHSLRKQSFKEPGDLSAQNHCLENVEKIEVGLKFVDTDNNSDINDESSETEYFKDISSSNDLLDYQNLDQDPLREKSTEDEPNDLFPSNSHLDADIEKFEANSDFGEADYESGYVNDEQTKEHERDLQNNCDPLHLFANISDERISTRINGSGSTRAQENFLITKYNSSNLGVLCRLKNLQIVLKRLEFPSETAKLTDKSHTVQKNFQCDVCQQVYCGKPSLDRHIKIHKRDKVTHPNEEDVIQESTSEGIYTRSKRKAATAALKKIVELKKQSVDVDTQRRKSKGSSEGSSEENSAEDSEGSSDENSEGGRGKGEGKSRQTNSCNVKSYLYSAISISRNGKENCKTKEATIKLFKCKICHNNYPSESLETHFDVHFPPEEFSELKKQSVVVATQGKARTKAGEGPKANNSDKPKSYLFSAMIGIPKIGNDENCKTNQATINVFKCKICHQIYPSESLERHFDDHFPPGERIAELKIQSVIVNADTKRKRRTITRKRKSILKPAIIIPKTAKEEKCKTNNNTARRKLIKCKFCHRDYTSPSLKRHFNTHIKANVFSCAICKKTLPNKNTLVKHLLWHHNPTFYTHEYMVARRFKCSYCEFSCNFVKQLSSHSSETGHVNEKTFKCNTCRTTFYKMTDLQNHKLQKHRPTMSQHFKCKKQVHHRGSFNCEVCEKIFPWKTALTLHTRTTHTKKYSKYKCEVCNDTFHWRVLMNEHTQVHKKEKFQCTVCGKTFLRKCFLRHHHLIHKKAQDKKHSQYYNSTSLNKQLIKCRICRRKMGKESFLKHSLVHKRIWAKRIKFTNRNKTANDENYYNKLISMNLFECNICQKTFFKDAKLSFQSSLKQHHKIVHRDGNFCECKTCGKYFNTSKDLLDHEKLYTNEKENYQCEFCQESFHTKFNFDFHNNDAANCDKGLKKEESNGEFVYECGVCDKYFQTKKERSQHFTIHKGTRVKCVVCEKTYSRAQFLSHWSCLHSSRLIFKCDLCEAKYDTETKLNTHKTFFHSDKKDFKCQICSCVFKYAGRLSSHERKTHAQENAICKKFECKLCDKKFATKKHMLSHERFVHRKDEAKFQCGECSKKFFTENTLNVHVRLHTGEKPFQCNKCDKKYRTRDQLANHASVHAGLKFRCQFCGKNFTTVVSMKTHEYLTHRDNIFQCEICGKSCKRKENLITHMRSHNGEKPYQCQECGKSCTRLDNLNVHLKWHEKMKLKAQNKQQSEEESGSDDE